MATAGTSANDARAFVLIAIVGSIPMLVLPFIAVREADNYRYAFAFLVPALWSVLLVRRWLVLAPFHYALLALALVLHNLGALGCYTRVYGGLAFDTYVHFWFGLVGALILERAFRAGVTWRGWKLSGVTLVFLLGLGAIHELVEAASTLALGAEVGMYKLGNPDEFDTQKDLLNNLLGGALALGLAWAWRRAPAPSGARDVGAP